MLFKHHRLYGLLSIWAFLFGLVLCSIAEVQAQVVRYVPTEYLTINEAYVAAAPGDTIIVDAGTYRESLRIRKPITILGNNADRGATGNRRAETVIESDSLNAVFVIECDCDVTIAGFTVSPGRRFALFASGNRPNITFQNNRILGDNVGGGVHLNGISGIKASDNLWKRVIQGDRPAIHVFNSTDVVLLRNTIDSSYAGIRLDGVQASDRSNAIQYNTIRNLSSYGVLLSDSIRALQNVLVAENLIERVNNRRFTDVGGITIDGKTNRGFNLIKIQYNHINVAFNGYAIKNLSNLTNDDITFRYNALTNHTNAGIYHGGSGVIDAIGNWWNDALGPQDLANPDAKRGLRIRSLTAETVNYAPWIYRYTDSANDTIGIQLRLPTTYGIRKSFPKTALPQTANNIATRNDSLLFLDSDYTTDDVRFTKDLVLTSKVRPTLRDISVGADTVTKMVSVVGNFNAKNVALRGVGNGGILLVRDTLFFSENITEDSLRHAIGTVQTSRTIGAGGDAFGNIGLQLESGKDNLNRVIITRKTGTIADQKVDGLPSMQIYFHLQTTGSNLLSGRRATFRWFTAFNNGVDPANIVLWERIDPKQGWKARNKVQSVTGQPQVWLDTLTRRGEYTFSAPPRCLNLEAKAGKDTSACIGLRVNLNGGHTGGNGAVVYQWQPTEGLSNPNSATPTFVLNTSRTFTLTVTDSKGCTSTDEVHVSALKKPIINAGKNLNLCKGQSGQFNVTGGVAYIWEPSNGLSDPYIGNPFVTVNQDTRYQVIGFGGNGCADTIFVEVKVYENPIIDRRNPDVAFCAGDSAGLRVTARGNFSNTFTYNWQPRTGLSRYNAPFTTARPAKTTVYTVTVTNEYGCSSFDTIQVTVHPTPKGYAGEDKTICAGTRIQLRATGGVTYLWGPTETMTDFRSAGPYVFPNVTTTYSVQVTDSFGCTSVDQVTITVLPNPAANAEGTTNICSGEKVRLNGFGGKTFYWSPPDLLDDPTASNPIASPKETTTFTLQVTDENGCNGLTFITINVQPRPEIEVTKSTKICLGETIKLSASGGVKYLWEPAIYLDNPESPTPNATPDVQTTYTVTVFNEFNCFRKEQVTVFVEPIPLAFAGYDQIICPGGKAQLLAIDGTGYSWQPATGLSDPNIANPIASPRETTTYTLTVHGRFGCTAIDSVTIFVLRNNEPLVRPSNNVFICKGGSVLLETFYQAEAAYQWYKDGQKLNGALSINYRVFQAGRYQVEVTLNGCSVKSAEVVVSEGGIPAIDAGEPVSVCFNGTGAQLNATGGVRYQWFPRAGLSNDTIPNPIANPQVTTVYTVYATDAGGCVGMDSVTVAVSVRPTVRITTNREPTLCFGEKLEMRVRPVEFAKYRWFRNGQPLPDSDSPVYKAELSGNYTCQVTLAGCDPVESDIINVTFLAPPTVSAGPDFYICTAGKGVKLQGRGDGPRGVQFRWEPNIGLSNTALADPIALPSRTTTYTLTVVDGRGCRSSDEVTVYVSPTALLPSPQILPAGDIKFCSGDSVTVDVPYIQGITYQWFKNEKAIVGADTNFLVLKEAGIYKVAISSAGCPIQYSANKLVLVNDAPLVSAEVKDASCPTCFDGAIRLEISGGTRPYSITYNSQPADDANITDLQYGTYLIKVKDAVNCEVVLSATIKPYPTSVADGLAESFVVYPNPNNGQFEVIYPHGSVRQVTLTTLTGQTVYQTYPSTESSGLHINANSLSSGIYLLKLSDSDGNLKAVQKIIIE
jgi:hypothetical protein